MTDLSENKEWQEWVASRPEVIQELCRKYPPDRPYRIQGGGVPGWIIAYSEFDEGGAGFRVRIDSPLFPREVLGLKPEDLEPWPDDQPLDIWGQQVRRDEGTPA